MRARTRFGAEKRTPSSLIIDRCPGVPDPILATGSRQDLKRKTDIALAAPNSAPIEGSWWPPPGDDVDEDSFVAALQRSRPDSLDAEQIQQTVWRRPARTSVQGDSHGATLAHDAFIDELRDAYDAERQLTQALRSSPRRPRPSAEGRLLIASRRNAGTFQRIDSVRQPRREGARKHFDGIAGSSKRENPSSRRTSTTRRWTRA